jgi:hypothetical protein
VGVRKENLDWAVHHFLNQPESLNYVFLIWNFAIGTIDSIVLDERLD